MLLHSEAGCNASVGIGQHASVSLALQAGLSQAGVVAYSERLHLLPVIAGSSVD